MGIRHFSGLFVLLCVGVTGALLTLAGEHAFYRLVLPHIRRRQKFKYWLHTSQKIHRALNMTYEDVKKQRANTEKSCNLQRSQPPQPSSTAAPTGSFARWNNESSRAAKQAAEALAAKDNKRVHFNLETLNTRRLLARMGGGRGGDESGASAASSGTGSGGGGAGAGAVGGGGGGGGGRSGARVVTSHVCENGGPAVLPSSGGGMSSGSGGGGITGHHHGGLSIPLPLPRSVASSLSASMGGPSSVPSVSTAVTMATEGAGVSSCGAPPRDGELEELTQHIDSIREQLKAALARRAELQTTLAKERASAAAMAPTGTLPLAVPLALSSRAAVAAAAAASTPKDGQSQR